MKWMYLFDAGGSCLQRRQLLDENWVAEIAGRSGAASYIVSEKDVEIERARNSSGILVDADPKLTLDAAWAAVREKRDFLLAASDYTQLPDVSLPNKEAWVTYRQALRDITTLSDPYNVVWPTPPA